MPHAPGFHGARDQTINLIGSPLVLLAAKNWRREALPKINLRPRAYRRPQNFVRAGVDFEQPSQSSLISLVWHVVLGPKQVPIQPFLQDDHSFGPGRHREHVCGIRGGFARARISGSSGCAPWRCSNYQSKAPAGTSNGSDCFLSRSPQPSNPEFRVPRGFRNPVLRAEAGRGSRYARL